MWRHVDVDDDRCYERCCCQTSCNLSGERICPKQGHFKSVNYQDLNNVLCSAGRKLWRTSCLLLQLQCQVAILICARLHNNETFGNVSKFKPKSKCSSQIDLYLRTTEACTLEFLSQLVRARLWRTSNQPTALTLLFFIVI